MNPNQAPIDVLHKSRLLSVCIGIGFVSCLKLAYDVKFGGGLRMILLALAGLFLLYFLFFEIQKIEFFPTYISIKYLLRRRLIERSDIDYVSMETARGRVSGVPISSNYIQVRLRDGRKINLGGFKESAEVAYQKLKTCESTNEEFLKGR